MSNKCDVFISYSSKEISEAIQVRDVLIENGISCWMAPDSLLGGTDYADEIQKAIENSATLVLMLSSSSQESQFVLSEVSVAFDLKKTIIPFVIEDCTLSGKFILRLATYNRINAYTYKNKDSAYQSLIKAISLIVNPKNGDKKSTELLTNNTVKNKHKYTNSKVDFGFNNAVIVDADGNALAKGIDMFGECNVRSWSDIDSVSCNINHTAGLKKDGTVVATGKNEDGQCNVKDWSDIVSVSCGLNHTVGLKRDGTVVATGDNQKGQCNVEKWSNIVCVSCGVDNTIGVKEDGTVVATGSNENGKSNVKNWSGIVSVSCGDSHTVGVKTDKTVVATGSNDDGECNVQNWNDIIAVSCNVCCTVGLKGNGTVVATGDNLAGNCNIDNWHDIIAIFARGKGTYGLMKDGSVICTNIDNDPELKTLFKLF